MSAETIKPLRPRTATDDFIEAAKVVAWALLGLALLLVFFALVFGALRAPDVFIETVLRLALVTIAIIVMLVAINVVQRIIVDRQDIREKEKLDHAARAIRMMLAGKDDKSRRDALNPFFDRLDVLELASKPLTDSDAAEVKTTLIAMDASAVLESQVRGSRRKWRQIQGLLIMGWLNDPKSLPVLEEGLADPDMALSLAAAEALAQYDSEDAFNSLMNALGAKNITSSRMASIIETSIYIEPIPILKDYSAQERSDIRYWSAYLLGRSGNKKALEILFKLARDDNEDVRASTAQALGDLGLKDALPLLEEMLSDSGWPVRAHAAKSIGQLGGDEQVSALLPLLHDQQWWVRQDAALSIERLGRAAVPYLIDLLEDKDRFTRNKSAEILGRLGLVTEWIEALENDTPESQKARGFLIKIGRSEAVNIIEEETYKANAERQSRLIDVLAEIGEPHSLPLLEELNRSNSDMVREHAKLAMEKIGRAA